MALTVPSPITRRRWLIGMTGLLIAPVIGYWAVLSPKVALLTTILGLSGMVLLAKPIWAIYALIVGTFLDSIGLDVGFAILGMGDLVCFALIPIWLAHRLLSPQDLQMPKGFVFLILFATLSFASMMLGVAPQTAYTGYARFVFYILVLVAFTDMVRDIEVLDRILIIVALCALAQALSGFILPASGHGRLSGLAQQPNILGAKIAFGIFPMAAFFMRSKSSIMRLLIGLSLGTMLVAIGLTMSRGSYIGVLFAGIFWVRHSGRSVLLFSAVGCLAFVGLNSLATERVSQIERRLQFDGSSAANRAQVMRNAFKAIEKYPIMGVGFAQFKQVADAVDISSEAGRGGHSFYLSTAASAGLPALMAFLLFMWIQSSRMNRVRKRLREDAPPAGESRSTETPWGDRTRALWVVNTVQAIMVFHGISLVVRGSQRLTEWTMFSLYAATAMLISRGLKRETQTASRPVEE